jgi:Holliday junction resolvase RusA-like endonuclease
MDLINQRGDPDGIVTTTLDCLKDAGVITDDAAKHCIRWKGQAYQDPSTEPRVIVQLERA